jgi:hypothetical protein
MRAWWPEEAFDPTDPKFEHRRKMASVRMDAPKFEEWLRNRAEGDEQESKR